VQLGQISSFGREPRDCPVRLTAKRSMSILSFVGAYRAGTAGVIPAGWLNTGCAFRADRCSSCRGTFYFASTLNAPLKEL
jgi:hypothetical protein